ncbi:phosphatidylserine/phosphatidylglycerophosphate/cardiolipin synthase family protein [Actinomadura sp. 3N508]|uniref:phosphatidylserine/phosphatidylglycerophosphate/ cardiolipin synthase family protein n=1 Tax=Actinomadura sp. 3N508 TaxID=3375153 RepID=UPI0037AD4CDE
MSRRRLRIGAACGTLLIPALLGLTAPATAESTRALAVEPVALARVVNYVEFDEGKHQKIAAHAVALINAANPGSTVRITLYYFDRMEVANALIAAAKRGVKVRIVMDGWNRDREEWAALVAASKAPTPVGERVALSTCGTRLVDWQGRDVSDRGCIANREIDNPDESSNEPSIMHNKFMTLSSVQTTSGPVSNVVYVSSANLDWWKGRTNPERTAYENVVTLASAELHKFFGTHYFEDLFNGPNTMGNNSYGDPDPDPETDNNFHSANHEVFTSPRQVHDGVGAAIERAARGCSTTRTDDIIKVANFRISRSNITGILAHAKQKGCTVQVVTGDVGDDPKTPGNDHWPALSRLLAANIDVKVCHPHMGSYSEMHEKTLMINHSPTAGLYIGSANMTDGALKYADESVLRIMKTSPIWARFDEHFDALHGYCPSWDGTLPGGGGAAGAGALTGTGDAG